MGDERRIPAFRGRDFEVSVEAKVCLQTDLLTLDLVHHTFFGRLSAMCSTVLCAAKHYEGVYRLHSLT